MKAWKHFDLRINFALFSVHSAVWLQWSFCAYCACLFHFPSPAAAPELSLFFPPLNNLQFKCCPSRQSTYKLLRTSDRVVGDRQCARPSVANITVRVKMTVTQHEAWLVMKKGNVAQPTSIPHYQTTCKAKRGRKPAPGWRAGVLNEHHKENPIFLSGVDR